MKLDSVSVGLIYQAKAQCPPDHKVIATEQGIMIVPKTKLDHLFDLLNGRKNGAKQ